jgi:hypothetical protein
LLVFENNIAAATLDELCALSVTALKAGVTGSVLPNKAEGLPDPKNAHVAK